VTDGTDKGNSETRTLAVVTLSHVAQHFFVGLSVLYPAMMADLNLTYTQLGLMTGVASITSGFLQMAWSLLNRWVSRRLLLGLGNLLISVGCVLFGRARGFVEVVGGNLISGGGQAAQHPVGTSILANKFSNAQVSRALSLHYGLGYVGNIVSPILLSFIAVSLDWRSATYVLALVPLVSGLAVLYFLKGEPSAARSISGAERATFWEDVKSSLRNKRVVLLIAAQAFAVGGTGMGVIISYAPLFLRNELNLGLVETSWIYSLAVIGGVLGTLICGYLAGRVGNLRTALYLVGVGSLLIFLLILHHAFTWILVPHLFLVGGTSFAYGSLLQAHLATILSPRQRDVVMGLYFTLGFGVNSIWNAVTGFLIDVYGSFTPAWVFRSILGAIAFVFIVLASRSTPKVPAKSPLPATGD
jgi:FSR family fosmidomycin resistance protein-like MFS transporter